MSEHLCHAEGCSVPVPPRMFMCRPHWYSLTKPIRDEIWRTYRPGQEVDKQPSTAYIHAAQKAVRFLRDRATKGTEKSNV